MSNNGAPDSWEQQADATTGDSSDTKDMSAKFSTLNVNAAEFVPSFSYTAPQPQDTTPILESDNSQPAPVTNGKECNKFE